MVPDNFYINSPVAVIDHCFSKRCFLGVLDIFAVWTIKYTTSCQKFKDFGIYFCFILLVCKLFLLLNGKQRICRKHLR